MSSPKKLKESIENIYNTSPLVICSDARLLFLKAWKYKVSYISNVDELREVIDYYTLTESKIPVVIDDVSLLNDRGMKMLLKFVEEYSRPLVLLSSTDNFDNILLSRVKTFIKFIKNPIKSDFMNLSEGLGAYLEKDFTDTRYTDKITYMRDKCPLLYKLEKELGNTTNKNKIISILGSD